MTDLVSLYNLALDASGSRDRIAAPTETSRQAETCELWYPEVRDQVLAAAWWPCTRANTRLALIVERDADVAWTAVDPDPGFRFAYAAPSDMLIPRYLSEMTQFVLSTSSTNAVVLATQTENAVLTYSKRQSNINTWEPQLKMAIIYGLAAHISIPLHGKNDRAALNEQRANNLILAARVAAANSGSEQYQSTPEWIAARGSSYDTPTTAYVFPYGSMISATGGIGVN